MEVDLVITPNGDRTVITPDNGEYYTKGELQGHLESGGLKALPSGRRLHDSQPRRCRTGIAV